MRFHLSDDEKIKVKEKKKIKEITSKREEVKLDKKNIIKRLFLKVRMTWNASHFNLVNVAYFKGYIFLQLNPETLRVESPDSTLQSHIALNFTLLQHNDLNFISFIFLYLIFSLFFYSQLYIKQVLNDFYLFIFLRFS